ncbi:MAG: TRAP transporter small permease subunit [Synechococcales bacterium]|nr:TRAP transporter small permease subunit [Synechococcales bacterium]
MRTFISPAQIQVLLRLSQQIDRLTDWIGRWSSGLVLLTIAIGFYNVTARYLGRYVAMKLSSNALIELQWYLFSLLFFLGFGYILKHGENVRVDFLYSSWTQKRRAWVDFLGTVFFLIPFCVLGIWMSWNPIWQSWGLLPDGSWGNWELSPDADGLPRAPIKTMLLVCFLLLLMQCISQTIKYFAVIKGYTQVAEQMQADIEQLPLE